MEINRSKEEVIRDVNQARAEAEQSLRVAGEVWSGQNAVASAWRSTRRTYLRTQDKVADAAYLTHKTVRENVYISVGVAFGIGAIIGYFSTNKPCKRRKA